MAALYALVLMLEDTHNKIDIAIEQLELALKIFLSGDSYFSSLTLAGAAEEILGMALKIKGIENSLQKQYKKYHRPELKWINPPKTWCEFTTHDKNRVRNAVKHVSNENDLTFKADILEEALWMIFRAIENYEKFAGNPGTVYLFHTSPMSALCRHAIILVSLIRCWWRRRPYADTFGSSI